MIDNKKEIKLPSVYFITLHKCASTLFSSYILKNIKGLKHINYAGKIYQGELTEDDILFKKNGYVYGPIRVSMSIIFSNSKLINIITNNQFIRDKKIILFLRDPRDILVSMYYSFGYSHGYSPVNKFRNEQQQFRHNIQNMTIDEFVLKNVEQIRGYFEKIHHLDNICNKSVVLRYEDMINDFDNFINKLSSVVEIDGCVANKIYTETRPKEKEDISSPRRSGRVGGYKDHLKKDTIKKINEELKDTLNVFGYEI